MSKFSEFKKDFEDKKVINNLYEALCGLPYNKISSLLHEAIMIRISELEDITAKNEKLALECKEKLLNYEDLAIDIRNTQIETLKTIADFLME